MKKTIKSNNERNNTLAIISYLGIFCLVPLLLKEKNDFVKFHAKQGLVLFIGEFISWILFGVIFYFLRVLGDLVLVFWLILSIIGIVNALNKEKKEIPLVGKIAANFKF